MYEGLEDTLPILSSRFRRNLYQEELYGHACIYTTVVQSRLGDSENLRLDRQDREDLTTTEL